MDKLSLTKLLEHGNSNYVKENCLYLVVVVEGVGIPEMIIIRKENFTEKIKLL